MSRSTHEWMVEPYKYRKIESGWPISGRHVFVIEFEGTDVRKFTGSTDDILELVSLLNTAWNLGYSTGSGELAGHEKVA